MFSFPRIETNYQIGFSGISMDESNEQLNVDPYSCENDSKQDSEEDVSAPTDFYVCFPTDNGRSNSSLSNGKYSFTTNGDSNTDFNCPVCRSCKKKNGNKQGENYAKLQFSCSNCIRAGDFATNNPAAIAETFGSKKLRLSLLNAERENLRLQLTLALEKQHKQASLRSEIVELKIKLDMMQKATQQIRQESTTSATRSSCLKSVCAKKSDYIQKQKARLVSAQQATPQQLIKLECHRDKLGKTKKIIRITQARIVHEVTERIIPLKLQPVFQNNGQVVTAIREASNTKHIQGQWVYPEQLQRHSIVSDKISIDPKWLLNKQISALESIESIKQNGIFENLAALAYSSQLTTFLYSLLDVIQPAPQGWSVFVLPNSSSQVSGIPMYEMDEMTVRRLKVESAKLNLSILGLCVAIGIPLVKIVDPVNPLENLALLIERITNLKHGVESAISDTDVDYERVLTTVLADLHSSDLASFTMDDSELSADFCRVDLSYQEADCKDSVMGAFGTMGRIDEDVATDWETVPRDVLSMISFNDQLTERTYRESNPGLIGSISTLWNAFLGGPGASSGRK